MFHARTNYIEIHHHFIREQVQNKEIEVLQCRTEYQLEDLFAKADNKYMFERFKDMLGLKETKWSLWGYYNI